MTLCWSTDSAVSACTNSINIASQVTAPSSANNISSVVSSGLTAGTTYYYKIVVAYSGGSVTSNITSFVPASGPVAVTSSASSITTTSAVLNGTVQMNGNTATASKFCWGTASDLGTCTSVDTLDQTTSIASTNTLAKSLSGLTAGTTYYFKIVVVYSGGTVTSNITSFVPSGTPSVTTSSATGVTSTTAVLNGVVNLNGNSATSSKFCWGTVSDLSSCSSLDAIDQTTSLSTANTITKSLTGLTANTTYYYKLVLVTALGAISSTPILSFQTAYAVTGTVTNIGLSSATMNGVLYAGSTAITHGQIQSVKLCYSTATTTTGGVLDSSTCSTELWTGTLNVSATGSLAFTADISSLSTPPPTTFQTQLQVVFSTSPSVIANGSLVPFTTLNNPDVAVNSATAVSSKKARIRGLVYPKGNRLSKVSFCWYETALGAGSQTCTDPVSTTDLQNNTVGWNGTTNTGSTDMVLSNLKPHTNYTYYIQANAQSSTARLKTSAIKFGTAAASPSVQSSTTSFTTAGAETFSATSVANTSATLHGTLYASSAGIASTGDISSVKICYNTSDATDSDGRISTASCSSELWANTVIAANGSLAYSPGVTGLLSGTKYYFQIQTTFVDGSTANGSILNFTTTQPPTATTSNATLVSQNSATLNGSFNANGSTVSSVTICYGPTDSFASCANSVVISAPSGGWTSGSNQVSTDLTGLSNNTLYYFTVKVTTSTGSVTASSLNFTTKSVVSFNSQGAGTYASQTYLAGGSIADPGTPSRSGYTFTGWWTGSTSGSKILSFPYSPVGTGNFTLYAQWTADSHTLHFSVDGGSAVSDKTFYSDGSVDVSDTTTKSGFTFLGWFTSTSSTTAVTSPYTPGVYTDVTLYAKWQAIEYSVTYYTNKSGSDSSVSATGVYTVGTTLTQPATPSNQGYSFAGWFDARSSGNGANFSTAQTGTGALTYYAQWTPYRVQFQYSGGGSTGIADAYGPVASMPDGSSLTHPAGQHFTGWACPANGSVYSTGSAFVPTGNVVCVAVFSLDGSKTVTFNSNYPNNSLSASTATQTGTTSATLASSTFAITGYTLISWNEAALGDGISHSLTSSHDFLSDLTLYAQWSPTNYDVTFNPNYSGAPSIPNGSYTVVSPASRPTQPTRAGYTFAGWHTSANVEINWGSNGTYQPSGTGTLALHAEWIRNDATVTFHSNYPGTGSQDTHQQTSNAFGVPLDAPTFTLAGYTFVKWERVSVGSGIYMASTDTYDFGANLNLYAVWAARTYSVTFLGQQPTSPTSSSGTYQTDGLVTLASDPGGYAGYTFLGWSDATNGAVVASSSATSYAPGTIGALTLYAQWQARTYVVNFDPQGGSAVPNGSFQTGGNVAAPGTATTKAGNHFNGWYIASTGGSALTFPYTPSSLGALTLYAQWTPYTVTFQLGSGGGTPATGTAPTGTVDPSGNITLPGQGSMIAPVGYVFTGWVCPTGTVFVAATVISPTSNTVCTAVWSPSNSKTVTFHSNYPFGSNTTTIQTSTGSHALNTNPFVAGGYRFIGWATSPTGAKSWDNTDVYDFSADADLYAVWEVIPVENNTTPVYTIVFVYQGGTPGVTVTYYSPGDPALKLPATEKPGYTFAGWSTTLTEPNTVSAPFTTRSSVTLFALWVAKTVTITFNYLGGVTGLKTMSYTVGQPGFTGLPTSSKQGYEFAGWSEVSGGSTAVTEPYSPLESLTLFAIWNGTKYTVTLVPQTGPQIKLIYTVGGDPLQLPSIGIKKDLVAVGWAPDNNASGAVPNPYRPNKSITLYPLWLTDRLKTPLYFAGDSAVLDAKAKAILKTTAKKIISAGLKPTLVVDGWVKATLDTSYDLKLSQARAANAAAYLRSLGINAFAKLTAKGIAPENNASARRVDLAVYLGGAKTKK